MQNQSPSNRVQRLLSARRRTTVLVGSLLILLLAFGSAYAAEMRGGDVFRLPAGEVVSDDLYVSAGEIFIDGDVEGDLIAMGGYIEVNGIVSGDLMGMGGGIVVNGIVEDDVRVVGGGISINGKIGDDLMAMGGGSWPGASFMPVQMGNRSVNLGIRLANSAAIDGDAFVVGGDGLIAASIGGDLFSAMSNIVFTGQVDGDANLNAQTLEIGEAASVGGTLTYRAEAETNVPSQVASDVVAADTGVDPETEQPSANLLGDILGWLLRTALVLIGVAILAWLMLRFAPNLLERPATALAAEPVTAGIYGLAVAVLAIPVSFALIFLVALFFGLFPGGVGMFFFVFGGLLLAWIFSPLVTGLWIGRKLASATGAFQSDLVALLVGVVLIVLVARVLALVPCAGTLAAALIYLLSFALASGGWISARTAGSRSTEIEAT